MDVIFVTCGCHAEKMRIVLSSRRELDFQLFQGLSFGLFFATFLHPCWTLVRFLFVANWRLGLHLAFPWVLAEASCVSLDVFCYPGGGIAGSWAPFCSSFEAICCTRVGLHFWRPCGTYLLVFEVSFSSLSFFHAPHSNKEPTGFQSGNNKRFTSPSDCVLQLCYTYFCC